MKPITRHRTTARTGVRTDRRAMAGWERRGEDRTGGRGWASAECRADVMKHLQPTVIWTGLSLREMSHQHPTHDWLLLLWTLQTQVFSAEQVAQFTHRVGAVMWPQAQHHIQSRSKPQEEAQHNSMKEEEMPEVEIDIDDLLEVTSDDERASKLQESLTDCYKPTEDFVRELLGRIRGMRKLSAPTKKGL
uniref:Protein phosphatase 1 regulatory subunit 14C n=1 Tax=Dicentrarchus labrax TaxID=13489 RepID=A0A8P4FWJ9_DICLA